MKRIVLGIQYDGAEWLGWQKQPNGQTVQDAVEHALRQFTLTEIGVVCAGRTDKGVHAIEQVVHFDTNLSRVLYSWVGGLNMFLPPSISVQWAHELPKAEGEEFHARFSALARTYCYVIYNHSVRSPLCLGKTGWVFRSLLDVEKMNLAAQDLLGTHDFSAFRAAECQANSPIKTIESICVVRHGKMVFLHVTGNAFLHHMVRNIVGCLVFIGTQKRPVEWLKEILESRDRKLAAPTFSPAGLYLMNIRYDARWGLPQSDKEKYIFFG